MTYMPSYQPEMCQPVEIYTMLDRFDISGHDNVKIYSGTCKQVKTS